MIRGNHRKNPVRFYLNQVHTVLCHAKQIAEVDVSCELGERIGILIMTKI